MTLMSKARNAAAKADIRKARTKHPEDQLLEIGVAWLDGQIGTADLCLALGRKPTSGAGAIQTVMQAIRRAVTSGRMKIKTV